jgi:hypothetical protein
MSMETNAGHTDGKMNQYSPNFMHIQFLRSIPYFLNRKKKTQCKDRLLFENTSSNFCKHGNADYYPIQAI